MSVNTQSTKRLLYGCPECTAGDLDVFEKIYTQPYRLLKLRTAFVEVVKDKSPESRKVIANHLIKCMGDGTKKLHNLLLNDVYVVASGAVPTLPPLPSSMTPKNYCFKQDDSTIDPKDQDQSTNQSSIQPMAKDQNYITPTAQSSINDQGEQTLYTLDEVSEELGKEPSTQPKYTQPTNQPAAQSSIQPDSTNHSVNGLVEFEGVKQKEYSLDPNGGDSIEAHVLEGMIGLLQSLKTQELVFMNQYNAMVQSNTTSMLTKISTQIESFKAVVGEMNVSMLKILEDIVGIIKDNTIKIDECQFGIDSVVGNFNQNGKKLNLGGLVKRKY